MSICGRRLLSCVSKGLGEPVVDLPGVQLDALVMGQLTDGHQLEALGDQLVFPVPVQVHVAVAE